MAQGEFTKEEAAETLKAVEELFEGIPKARRGNYPGHLNDIVLFIEAAKKAAPGKEDSHAKEENTKTKESPKARDQKKARKESPRG